MTASLAGLGSAGARFLKILLNDIKSAASVATAKTSGIDMSKIDLVSKSTAAPLDNSFGWYSALSRFLIILEEVDISNVCHDWINMSIKLESEALRLSAVPVVVMLALDPSKDAFKLSFAMPNPYSLAYGISDMAVIAPGIRGYVFVRRIFPIRYIADVSPMQKNQADMWIDDAYARQIPIPIELARF